MPRLASIPNKYIMSFFAGATLILWSVGLLPIEVMLLLFGFGTMLYLYPNLIQRGQYLKAFSIWLGVVIFGLAIGLYRPEGFNYPLIFDLENLHENGQDFSLYLNTGKTIAGYMVLAFLSILPVLGQSHINRLSGQILSCIILPTLVLLLAYIVLDLNTHLKSINYVLAFGVVNLFATCISEEAFMRLIFQKEIGRLIGSYNRNIYIVEGAPLLLTTILFTATHIGSSLEITIVYTVAGFFYGLIYSLTKNIWHSITCHFIVNILHFGFLTYPIS